MNRKVMVLLMALGALGCGFVERVSTSVTGMHISETQTEKLICAVAQFGGSVSIDCVRRQEGERWQR
jgi:hypothetical protein